MSSELPPFIKGLELSELYFIEAVQPVLSTAFPQFPYAAARLDFGSDVLGFDTPMSRDHHWGPRLALYLREEDLQNQRDAILRALSQRLPKEIRGYPTHFADLHLDGGVMQPKPSGPITPYISLATVRQFMLGYTGIDINRALAPADWLAAPADWLAVPWQRLATIRSGKIFHDGLGTLAEWKARLQWYPHDLWLYILAAQWRRIDQEEPFVGRCGDVGDDLGSREIAARQVHRLMELCFLMEKHYPPYSKWFGTAFRTLNCAADLLPIFARVHESEDWKEREHNLSDAYLYVANLHNRLGLTDPVPPEISSFHNRPYQVPHAGRYAQALQAKIKSDAVLSLPPHIGCIDQFVESTDVLESIELCQRVKAVYRTPFVDRFPDPCPLVVDLPDEKEELL